MTAELLDLGSWKRQDVIDRCLKSLRENQLLVFPTDTVYGVLSAYNSYQSVQAIYKMKQRSLNQPLILLGNTLEQLQPFIQIPKQYEETIQRLTFKHWPGALTLILPKTSRVPRYLNSHKTSIGIRVPAHDLLLELLAEWGAPLASTSANTSGLPPASCAQEAKEQFVDYEELGVLVEQGYLESSQPSTIIDFTGSTPYILRQGALSLEL